MIDTIEYLDKMGLRTFLIGSTLLQVVRNRELKYRHTYDKELNIGCYDEELTPEILAKIEKDKPYFVFQKDENRPSLIFFGDEEVENRAHWVVKGNFTLLVPFFVKDKLRVEYMGGGHCLTWPKRYLGSLRQIDYKGYKLNVPSCYKAWLKHYFGEGWRKEDLDWHWHMATNYCLFTNLKLYSEWRGGELC